MTVRFGASASLRNWRHLELEDVVQIDVSSAHAFQYHSQFPVPCTSHESEGVCDRQLSGLFSCRREDVHNFFGGICKDVRSIGNCLGLR